MFKINLTQNQGNFRAFISDYLSGKSLAEEICAGHKQLSFVHFLLLSVITPVHVAHASRVHDIGGGDKTSP